MAVLKNQNTAELDRLFVALSARTQIKAATLLGIRQSMLSDCTRRGSAVSDVLLENTLKLGVRLEWIKDGELPMKRASPFGNKCDIGRYCLESCPALEAVQRVVSLVSSCGYICGACKYRHSAIPEREEKISGQTV